ncbi:MAG: hypothetical protein C7B44_12370 [Sulfobacillus thermosulfidooxidans]|uniref:YlzJ-like protein n=1 Tax=Sulfobacillus thermotolerans TaxID=338644 RepID=A0ABM6RR07_9FIRM|nr:YlzJ-like family protein [Sulfobacillus sp. hq2]AUW93723.1 hypothetical protein BXT84_07015 [Sulfobacillus thermotolerans]MCY0908645.1 YlzJ-like family protein [Sulfobacillus thermotolerans]POB10971.1 hypothetical protein CO251_09255 [Sulfobacillus sp. hq2]PSR35792.1 MAG: hypothetical protein C7B44_12370 [Sulfobacillus thermosulfidooxidans]
MLYTPLAMEDIYPRDPHDRELTAWWIDGRLCLIRRDGDGSARLERLLSTDPMDYLDERFQPNRLVSTMIF